MIELERLLEGGLADAQAVRDALQRHSEQAAGVGSWAWDTGTDEVVWSANLFALYELEEAEAPPSFPEWLAMIHPDDRAALGAALAAHRAGAGPAGITIRAVTEAGRERLLELQVAGIDTIEAGRRVVYGVTRDLTRTREADRRIALHMAVTRALVGWEEFEAGARELLHGLADALDLHRGVLWVPGDGTLTERVVWWREEPAPRRRWHDAARSLARRAWETGAPVEPTVAAPAAGTRTVQPALAFPALSGTEPLAIISLGGAPMRRLTPELAATLAGIGHEIGEHLLRRRADLAPHVLTGRERELLQVAAEGLPSRIIAERLGVAESTVKTHFENVFRKYGVPDRTAAVAKALREGLIS